MSDDAPLKSAYEIAMERLRAEDRAAGTEKTAPLTKKQKARIAELRAATKAELAQLEIMRKQDLAGADPGKVAELEENYLRDRRRAQSALEEAIARVRSGKKDD